MAMGVSKAAGNTTRPPGTLFPAAAITITPRRSA
jgi:hypothetical protein